MSVPVSIDDFVEKQEASINAYFEKKHLYFMTKEELKLLPKSFIIHLAKNEIEFAWKLLPNHLVEDKDILQYRRCKGHSYLPRRRTCFDGPNPFKKDCPECR